MLNGLIPFFVHRGAGLYMAAQIHEGIANFYSVNELTGAVQLIGPLGIDIVNGASGGCGMVNKNGIIYLVTGERLNALKIYTVNVNTGAVTFLRNATINIDTQIIGIGVAELNGITYLITNISSSQTKLYTIELFDGTMVDLGRLFGGTSRDNFVGAAGLSVLNDTLYTIVSLRDPGSIATFDIYSISLTPLGSEIVVAHINTTSSAGMATISDTLHFVRSTGVNDPINLSKVDIDSGTISVVGPTGLMGRSFSLSLVAL